MEASKMRITPAFWEATHVGSGGSHDNPTDIYEVTNHYTRICEYCTEADAKLIVEAGNTYHETGKTPRQLAEENARLRLAVQTLMAREAYAPLQKVKEELFRMAPEIEARARAALTGE